MNLKSLAKDTAIYGLSSIVGRFLNYLLVPLYTWKITAESGGYGIVTNLYAYAAFFLALLTFGMETTLFRFASKEGEDGKMVYSNALRMVGGVALVFVALVAVFLQPVSGAMGYADHPEYVLCFAVITAFDAIQAIMFSRLRQQHRPVRFMLLKFAYIIPSILLNLFIFLVMDRIPACEGVFHHFNDGVGLIFFANLICTAAVTTAFIPELKGLSYGFDRGLARRMLSYSWPLLLLSLVGILNQVADKMLFPWLMPGEEGMRQLGIYGACVKIAMIISLLTQAFRYAYEPIVFGSAKDRNSPETLADGMKYFVVFSLLAFLAVMFYMPLLKYLVGQDYWSGLKVVPVVMMAEIFMGVYFNLSFWYKLGSHNQRRRSRRDDSVQRAAGSGNRLLGLRLGRIRGLRHSHAAELPSRQETLPRALRLENHNAVCRTRAGPPGPLDLPAAAHRQRAPDGGHARGQHPAACRLLPARSKEIHLKT